ncbi:MAG: hypothetical protein NTY02_04985 [Acidobacteria bacterium]|nr:hypothetical protein [Acidobacteriota bacterium]
MAYTPVKRTVTIVVERIPRRDVYRCHVTPERQEVHYGDTVVWHVQGAPGGVEIRPANIRPQCPDSAVTFRQRRLKFVKPATIPSNRIKRNATGWSLKVPKVPAGWYKYDVLWNGEVWVDPELEIKGPGGKA